MKYGHKMENYETTSMIIEMHIYHVETCRKKQVTNMMYSTMLFS